MRLARDGVLTRDQYKLRLDRVESDPDLFVLRDLSRELCRSPNLPAVATPRSLDLAHLSTALWFHAAQPIHRFVTLDGSQKQAAKELGLPV